MTFNSAVIFWAETNTKAPRAAETESMGVQVGWPLLMNRWFAHLGSQRESGSGTEVPKAPFWVAILNEIRQTLQFWLALKASLQWRTWTMWSKGDSVATETLAGFDYLRTNVYTLDNLCLFCVIPLSPSLSPLISFACASLVCKHDINHLWFTEAVMHNWSMITSLMNWPWSRWRLLITLQ